MKLSKKNIVKGGLSLAALAGGLLTVKHANDNNYGKVKVIKVAAGATGALLGLVGVVKVIDEEFRPEMDEEDTKFDTEDFGEDMEDDFFKDLEDELMDEEDREDEDYGDETPDQEPIRILQPDEGLMPVEEHAPLAPMEGEVLDGAMNPPTFECEVNNE